MKKENKIIAGLNFGHNSWPKNDFFWPDSVYFVDFFNLLNYNYYRFTKV